jgi:hypothetical protein
MAVLLIVPRRDLLPAITPGIPIPKSREELSFAMKAAAAPALTISMMVH